MPRFNHRDNVRISPDAPIPHAGETGVIWGVPNSILSPLHSPVDEAGAIRGEEQVQYRYQVDLDSSETETVTVMESDLLLA